MANAALHYRYDRPYVLLYAALIVDAARAYGLPAHVLAGIMSRESGGGRLLHPPGPAGTGDAGHGHGPMQIDDRSHPDFTDNELLWTNPRDNINYGARLLASYRDQARARGVPETDALRVAIAGYNQGLAGAVSDWRRGDPDLTTTGHNYSRDVLARAELFKNDFAAKTGSELKAALLPIGVAWLLGLI